MIRNDLETRYIQFTWDLLNPWWPSRQRDEIAREWSQAFKKEGLILTGTSGGLASYTYPQLMAPTTEQRKISLDFFKRAIDLSAVMESSSIGTPLGGMTHNDAYDKKKREEIYSVVLDLVRELAAYAKKTGLEKIVVEPTPLFTEFPNDPKNSLKLMQDLNGTTDVPVRLLVDWGHAILEPFLKEQADMENWLSKCQPYIDCFHLQQTDGLLDRHWSFTHNGKLNIDSIRYVIEKYNLNDLIQYVEVIYPFEETDENVYDDIRKTMCMLQNFLGEGGY
jgi:sugar phosphate isomerase/epimerase